MNVRTSFPARELLGTTLDCAVDASAACCRETSIRKVLAEVTVLVTYVLHVLGHGSPATWPIKVPSADWSVLAEDAEC